MKKVKIDLETANNLCTVGVGLLTIISAILGQKLMKAEVTKQTAEAFANLNKGN